MPPADMTAEDPASVPTTRSKGGTACDACKRRKVKCTGSQPCERCISSNVACTYGSSASRSTALTYTRHLEAKVAELQALLQQQPDIDPGMYRLARHMSNDSQVDLLDHLSNTYIDDQNVVEQSRWQARSTLIETLVGPGDDYIYSNPQDRSETFHGRFAGLSLLRTVRDLCDQLVGASGNHFGRTIAEAFDYNLLDTSTSHESVGPPPLPAPKVLRATIACALDGALSCQDCIDRTELRNHVERLYSSDPEDWTLSDRRALSLVYALMALGRQRSDDEPPPEFKSGVTLMKGVSYYRASRAMLEATDCNHLDSIRAIICLANYLLSASMASKAYTCICLGVAAAMRMGLHVYSSTTLAQYTSGERTNRRRVFAVLNCTQTYLASVLGMPLILQDSDVEQILPLPEEDLGDQGRSLLAREPLSPLTSTILLCKLVRISADVTKSHFSDSRADLGVSGTYSLEYDKVMRWEKELDEWRKFIPPFSLDTMDQTAQRSQFILRFVGLAQRIAIYRPFLRHILRREDDPHFDSRGLQFGKACLQASLQAIRVAEEMDDHALLSDAQWYVIYDLALATSSLMLVVLGAGDEAEVEEADAAVNKAHELLSKLGRRSLSAKKCADSLWALQDAASKSRTTSLSPRTQFMQAVGATGF